MFVLKCDCEDVGVCFVRSISGSRVWESCCDHGATSDLYKQALLASLVRTLS